MKIYACFNQMLRIVFLACLLPGICHAQNKPTIRLGVLAFGTVNWELNALKNEHLLEDAPFTLNITPVATPQAGKIALQSNAVDVIVSDWIWVSRMRSSGADYTFYPYSATSGAIVVPSLSPIQTLADLQDKRIGIAGGELDKNWLLLQALANKQGLDYSSIEKIYGAPPLLNQQLKQQRVDAIINYWHFAARLEADGYRVIETGSGIINKLGINQIIPSLGYVFRQSWAASHLSAINSFLKSTQQAKDQLCSDLNAWQKISRLTRSDNPVVQNKLRDRYCQGRVLQWEDAHQLAAEKIYQHLQRLSNNKLTGHSATIQPGTFWKIN